MMTFNRCGLALVGLVGILSLGRAESSPRAEYSKTVLLITEGEIEDAKTIIGLMLAAPRLGASLLEPFYPAV